MVRLSIVQVLLLEYSFAALSIFLNRWVDFVVLAANLVEPWDTFPHPSLLNETAVIDLLPVLMLIDFGRFSHFG